MSKSYKAHIVKLANVLKIKPEYIEAIEEVYEFLCRFAVAQNIKELNNLRFLINGKEERINHLTLVILEGIYKKYGSIGVFFSPLGKEKYFNDFVKMIIKRQLQPSKIWQDGTLVYTMHSATVIEFQETKEVA